MKARRATFIALRVLALYLAIRGVETAIRYTSFGIPGRPWGDWISAIEPVVASIVLWFVAEPLARRLARARPMTDDELDDAVADDEEQERGWDREASPDALLKAALLVLGVFFLAGGLQSLAFNLPAIGAHRFTSLCATFGPHSLPGAGQNCGGFWDPDTVKSMISAGAGLVEIAIGSWLIASPLAMPGLVKRWWDRRRGPDPRPFDDDEPAG